MNILKKENWWIWLILMFLAQGASTIVLGALLDVYKRDAWYTKWQYWVMGILFFLFPFLIMIAIFMTQILVLTAAKLNVPGKEIYLSPYIWILCLIVPIIGWIMIPVMYIYLQIWSVIKLSEGEGEQYI